MPKTMIFKGKTTNEAIEKGLKELRVTKDEVDIKILEEEKRSFFSILEPRVVKIEMTVKEEKDEEKNPEKIVTKVKIEDISKEEIEKIKLEVDKFLKEMISLLPSSDIIYSVDYDNQYITVKIDGKDISYLIGYRGEVLNALQTILSAIIIKHTKYKIKATLDIGNYKEKRKKTLESLAIRTANTVIKTGKKVTLEPMTSYERKIIHNKLQENNKVKTYSVGEEPHRKIVISLR